MSSKVSLKDKIRTALRLKGKSTDEVLGKAQDLINTAELLSKSLPTPLQKRVQVALVVSDVLIGATVAIRKVLGR